ncbi:MAG: hypothetical protein AABY09_02685 [Nanoarchaeota archaeon]
MIEDFCRKFTAKSVDYEKAGNAYYIIPKELKEIESFTKPVMMGLYLGEDRKEKFFPSLALLTILAKTSEEKVCVKDIGEMDFVYGKDLRKRHILKFEGETKIGFLKIVVNKNGECLGYGKIIGEKNSEGVIVKNVLDIGDYIRREKNL